MISKMLRGILCLRVPNQIIQSAASRRNISLSSSSGHIYQKIWKKHELVDYLSDNIYYEDEDYIVVSKPYGVLTRINKTKTVEFKSEGPSCESTLSDILSDLSARLGEGKLGVLVNPERLFSGVVILSKDEENKSGILGNFERIKEENRMYSYLAVVLGDPPAKLEESIRVCANKDNTCEISKDKKKGFNIHYKHEVLDSSNGTCLVKVDMNYNYLQALRLVLSTKFLSPVLGDFIYSARVTTLFDVPLVVPPNEQLSRKILKPELLKLLQLNPDDIDCCPCHIHLYSTMFRLKAKKFVVSVPPPNYFVWTCKQLGLKQVEEFLRGIAHRKDAAEADCR